jgi:hypothetical protein
MCQVAQGLSAFKGIADSNHLHQVSNARSCASGVCGSRTVIAIVSQSCRNRATNCDETYEQILSRLASLPGKFGLTDDEKAAIIWIVGAYATLKADADRYMGMVVQRDRELAAVKGKAQQEVA